MFNLVEMSLLAVGALLAGFIAGLTGFGTAMTALAFWLYVVTPVVAAPLVAICAIGAHIMSVRKIWNGFDFTEAKPVLLGGLIGVPLGIAILTRLSPDLFRGLIGSFLAVYALILLMMKKPPLVTGGGRFADGAIGFVGGALGGFAGLSGPVPTLWSVLRGWSKERQRSIIQGFNMLVLAFALCVFAFKGMLDGRVMTASMICLPATFIGSWVGTKAYLGLDAEMFRRIILGLIFISGLVLSSTWLLGQ